MYVAAQLIFGRGSHSSCPYNNDINMLDENII